MDIDLSNLSVSFPPQHNVWGTLLEQEVRILHKPTGICVSSHSKRSTYANRQECMRLLELKLTENLGEGITWT